MKIHSFNVIPNLPESLKPLAELTQNMWFTWNWEAIEMFVNMNGTLWQKSHRNPKWVIGALSAEEIEKYGKDEKFLEQLSKITKLFNDYKNGETWYQKHKTENVSDIHVAYFSMEFGIGEGLPMYSGGLGILAGDHIKSSSDLGIPLVGVGLLYQKGYIQQVLNREGWQMERYPENDWANMPVEMVKAPNGEPLMVDVPLGNETIKVAVWKVPVGRTVLYLLDTNLQENPKYHREITEQLYGGDRSTRIRQEIVLGLGGVRALKAMGMNPTVYHINEGHSAFLLFERIKNFMAEKGVSFNEAKEYVWASSVFTTHTPVIAGNEHFDPELVKRYLEPYSRELGLTWDEFMAFGKEEENSSTFCMTVVALKLASYLNGVAKLHGEVSREMWQKVWPNLPVKEIPIGSITNGIHTPSWITHEHLRLYLQFLQKPGHEHEDPAVACDWEKIDSIPDEMLWDVHSVRKQKLIKTARGRYRRQLKRLGADVTILEEVDKMLDPKVLTIGFARRFATYKRATLLFRDVDRIARILNNPARPVQLVFAGKAHQADTEGKELVKFIAKLTNDERFKGKLIFIEDYNMNIARYMVQGVDVWLNNPIRPMEASGTSGMKASLNGVMNLSVLDGWWAEGYSPDVGWAIGGSEHYHDDAERDTVESEAICNLIEKEIAPLYYKRDENNIPSEWLKMMKNCIRKLAPQFSTHRMVIEYYERFYVNAHRFSKELSNNENLRAVSYWRKRISDNWNKVNIVNISEKSNLEIRTSDKLTCSAKVWMGGLTPEEVSVEAYVGQVDHSGDIGRGEKVELKNISKEGDAYIYSADLPTGRSGRKDFALRVLPKNDNIPHPYMPFHIKWEDA